METGKCYKLGAFLEIRFNNKPLIVSTNSYHIKIKNLGKYFFYLQITINPLHVNKDIFCKSIFSPKQ